MVKTQKKQRKEGTNDFESTSRDRDDVQSPAYSDISDDSTPVAESEISGKHLQNIYNFVPVSFFRFVYFSLALKFIALKHIYSNGNNVLSWWIVSNENNIIEINNQLCRNV